MSNQQKKVTGFKPRPGGINIRGRSLGYYMEMAGPLLAIILFAVFMAFAAPRFFLMQNLINILYSASIFIIMAVGMTFVITGAGIDLSVGSMLALSGVLMCFYIKFTGLPPIFGIPIALIAGTLLGAFNGLIIVKLRLPEFIATIATMIGYRGIVLILAGGYSMYRFPPEVVFLGKYRFFGVFPLAIVIAFVTAIVGYFMYRYTTFGRYTAAMGGDREAAILAGINVNKYKILNFAFMGFLAGLVGVITIGRLDSFHANFGTNMEIHTIAAVIIGGTALYGGVGKIWGSLAGAILMAMVTNGMVILRLPYFYQYVAVAIVIILAVSMYTLRRRRE